MTIKDCFALAISAVFTSTSAASALVTVSNTADSGAGSLRQAIIDANTAPGADLIDFDIPSGSCSAAGVCSIVLLSDLPDITDEVLIDGTTQPRYGTAPSNVCATALDPSYMRIQVSAPHNALMLVLTSTGASMIRGLSLSGGYPISLRSAAAHHVACNHIGVNGPGDGGRTTSSRGITIENLGQGAIIGTNGDGVDDIGERNVFGRSTHGIYINGNQNNWIAGNYFGFGADGVTPIGHAGPAIYMRQGSSGNLVGTDGDGVSDDIERNIIGNNNVGVWIDSRSGDGDSNEVVGNWVGVDAAGEPAGNTNGIFITSGGTNHLVQDNYVGSSSGSGIRIGGATTLALLSDENCLVDNSIGFYHGGSEAVVFEGNWWGAGNGPSGLGSGSGDSVNEFSQGVVDYTPWLTSAPEACSVPEPSPQLLSAVAMGILASLHLASRRRRATPESEARV